MTRPWLIPLVLLVAGCGTAEVPTAAQPAPTVRSSWGTPEQESVALVRRIVVTTRGAAELALARCQAHAHERRAAYIRCALPTLAQLGTSGEMDAMILLRLSPGASPTCLGLIHSLAGTEGNLGTIARLALREEIVRGPQWAEVAHAAQAIRTLAATSEHLAARAAWRTGCAPPIA